MNASGPLPMWVIYDHPKDFPHNYVARKFLILPGQTLPTQEVIVCAVLDEIRIQLDRIGLVPLPRHETDDACIVESWI